MRNQQDTLRPKTDGSADLEVRATYTRKPEFAPHVTITEETFFGHGWQPLTIAFAQALWFLPPDQSFDVPFLVAWLEQLGWKGANGKPIGANVVRRELGLLREAGYVQSHRLRGEGGKAVGIQYVVSQRRTDQPETGSWIPAPEGFRSSDHVSSMATRGQSPHVAIDKKTSSDHMAPLTTPGQSPRVVDGAKPQVAPRGTNGVHPPHPPEEVTTSSPYPLTDSSGSLPSQREEGEGGFASKDLHAAESFLQQLRPPHHMGAASARKYAPLLLGAMAEQGWPSIFEVDHTVLAREVTRDPQGFKRPSSLVPTRIRDLPRYAIVTGASASHGHGTGAERCPEHPARYRRGCVECALTVPV
ncbi:hypothetical protein ABTX34_34475 [Streptomyces sp. NPDC096538]|uniref:hypothetical protein n=1 Tax=Streptomyces sp. NPDC096538 TaxID=3155427 RepID=UPI00332897C0